MTGISACVQELKSRVGPVGPALGTADHGTGLSHPTAMLSTPTKARLAPGVTV